MLERLLAKSPPKIAAPSEVPLGVFLPDHLRACHDGVEAILQCTVADQLAAMGLATDAWSRRFCRVVRLAAALHDLGKANDHFQGVVQDLPHRRGKQQGLRHEWVTFVMLHQKPIAEWYCEAVGGQDVAMLAVECAITGHHPSYGRAMPPTEAPDRGQGSELLVYYGHSDFLASLEFVAVAFGLSAPPRMPDVLLPLLGAGAVFQRIQRLLIAAEERWQKLNSDECRFVAAVKACLVAGDVAGSALPRKIPGSDQRSTWIHNAFALAPTGEQLAQIVETSLTDNSGVIHPLRPFQKTVADEAGDVTFVRAGCGTGKTTAAYHWASIRWPGKRLYFCYPTTGTATEGYRDYLFDAEARAGRFGANLFHGRADVDLEVVLGVDADVEDDGDEALVRMESLDAWSTPIACCTVDAVLGLMQNYRRGLYSWPALAKAAFVFDEVHAYDDRLFGALLAFLEGVRGVPVMLMSASLPQQRLEALKECVSRRGAKLAIPQRTDDLRTLEERPRYYRLECEFMTALREEIAQGGKVLCVCNTVDRALSLAEHTNRAGLQPIVYHSRFRYEDRVKRHNETICAFRGAGPALAVCTQVAEMSLNISATLLVTDVAPVPALIQRLGRLNRHAAEGDPPRPFVVVDPRGRDGEPVRVPYDTETHGDWLTVARRWLDLLPCGAITQADLAATWEHIQAAGDVTLRARPPSAWLDGGPLTQVCELRKGSRGLTVVIEEDYPALKAGTKRLAQVTIPMPSPPRGLRWQEWVRYKGIPVCPRGTLLYDQKRGARWQGDVE